MRWQIMKDGKPTTDDVFDDGIQASPGEEGFTTEPVKAAAELAGADGWNYVGLSPEPQA